VGTYQELRKKINQTAREIKEIEKYLREGEYLEKDPEKNAYQIEDRLKRIEQKLVQIKDLVRLRDNLEELRRFIGERMVFLEPFKKKIKSYLGVELEKRFREQGWYLEGNLPELKVGLLTLEVLFPLNQVRIWYGPKIEPLGYSKLVIDEIVNGVIKIYKDLDKRSFKDEEKFLKLLYEAYKRFINREGLDLGANIPIISWLRELTWLKQDSRFFADPRREYFKNYGRIQLSYDLSRLRKRQYDTYELRLVIASREQTKKKEDNLWVPNNMRGDGCHFASICFRGQLS
jgi:hypothetical protein